MPSSVIAAVLLLAAMTPGYAFHRSMNRYRPKDTRSSTTEVVELFSVGALATAAGLLLTLLLGELAPFLVTLREVTKAPAHFRDHPWSWVGAVVLAMALSMALSTLAGVYAGRKSPRRTGAAVREGTVAVHALTDRAGPDKRRKPFVSVELSDGRLVEGYVRYVSTDPDPARRDIVLQRPIAWTGPGAVPRTASPAVCVFVPGALVRVVHISYPPAQAPSATPVLRSQAASAAP
ncbi:DUF6338 family protein [Streptomyces sp. NBC_01166]|uniref:DUF6338 family protein n=1 Tax=Streptomyces sp. NBC_01166 TaxID=2903755 RepID=UPI003869AF69|nr:DUF6338 family protein [Streptomyces sp. NBC_01166]